MNGRPDHDDAMRALLRRSRAARQLDPARAARVRAAVHAAWAGRAPRTVGWRWRLAAGAAAAAVVAAYALTGPVAERVADPAATVGSVQFVTGTVHVRSAAGAAAAPIGTGDRLTAGAALVTGEDSRGTIVLPDGVEVRLDRQTIVVVESGRRLALEDGAIYIDTTPRRGPPDPVEVMARGAVVRDIGTRYEVRVSNDVLRVRVRAGRVHVTRGADAREAAPGAEVTLTSNDMRVTTIPVFGRDWDWIVRATRPPQIEGRSLADFLAWVQREGGREVRFADAALERSAARTMVYGAIDGLTIEEALDVVLPTCGLAHRNDGATITIIADDTRGAR